LGVGHVFGFAALIGGVGLVAASFPSIAHPQQALALLKRLGLILAGIIIGAALLQKILAEIPGAGSAAFLALLIGSPIAYCIREAGRKKPVRKGDRRARERLRAGAWHPEERPQADGEEE
jgi:hypothetical protein